MTTTVQAGEQSPAAGPVTPTGRLILHHTAAREVWLDARRQGIGSSDLPAVMGLSGFKTPLHVFHDKRGRLPHDDEFSEAAHFGVLFEEPLARDWARRNRTVVESVGLIANIDEPWQLCTLDRLCTECPLDRSQRSLCALEVKTRNAFISHLWRQGPPDDVLAQVLWQILVTGLDHIHVVCLIGGQDYRQYTVRRDEHVKLVAYLHAEASRLWHEHIVPGRAPALSGEEPPDALIELYDRLHPDRDGVTVLDRDLDAVDAMSEYMEAAALESEGKARKKVAKAKLLGSLGSAQAAVRHDKPFFSIEQSFRKTPDLARLAEEFPEAYRACVADVAHDRIAIPKYVREEFTA
ncbi:YqaJ viral recombinase family nuclease [Streptomyces chartreusis]|uniref:YqaJ viral recombinase family nuclease n=1 Tax=Streptomyces chartreusis TaxID=1969 RepID=UPI0037FC3948